MAAIKIVNWGKFQHYKDRSPPWIKLHRSLLHKREWRETSAGASKLLVDLWMLASEYPDGAIPFNTSDLAWALRISDPQVVSKWLIELCDKGFVELCEHDASTVLAVCQQLASGETEGEERQRERESSEAKASGVPPDFEPAEKPPNPQGYLMGVLRECGYACDRTDGSIVKALLVKNAPERIEEAVRGLAVMWRRGELRAVRKPNMRLLYAENGAMMPLWTKARVAYEQDRKNFKPANLAVL